MENVFLATLSWWQFLWITGLLLVLYFILKRFRSYVLHLFKIKTLQLPFLIMLFVWLFSFIMVKPLVHAVFVGLLILMFYALISSFIKGKVLVNNADINIGDHVKIGNFKGLVQDISVTGLTLLTDKNNLFVPYTKMAHEVVEKFNNDQFRYLSLQCSPGEGMDKISTLELEKIAFDFPFLAEYSKIGLFPNQDGCEIQLTLANERFKSSLIKNFTKAGYIVKQIEKLN